MTGGKDMIEGTTTGSPPSRLRFGMVGGGPGSFIGDVHRKAASFDGRAAIVAGCFSRESDKTLATGLSLGLDEARCYRSFEEMAERESRREDRIDFVSITTPNNSHYAIARTFLESGIPVVCDKPLTRELKEAQHLARLVAEKDLLFCVTYTYTGYPMVKHARDLIRQGAIGAIRFVNAEYPQDWLATPLEKTGQKQASWRTDPEQSGAGGSVGDIGSHIENLVTYLTGLEIESLSARLDTFVPGRLLDDNASILVDYKGGSKGLYWCSQIAVGWDNALSIRIFGETGSIEFHQEDPNYLKIARLGKPTERLSRGRDALSAHASSFSRVPSGHPEGYYEAFANLYGAFMDALAKKSSGARLGADDADFPNVEDGVRGVRFITRCIESARKGSLSVRF
jgi:predicted dehydrogenase